MKAYDIKEESPLYSVKRAQYKTLRLEPYTVLYAKTTAKIHSPEYQKVVNNLLSDAKDLQILHKSIEANFKMPPLEISVYKDKREYEFRMPIPNITAQKLREHMNLLNSRTEVRTIDLGWVLATQHDGFGDKPEPSLSKLIEYSKNCNQTITGERIQLILSDPSTTMPSRYKTILVLPVDWKIRKYK